jgi:hypothetical protein
MRNIGIALWWAVITMTTVGYGDVYPESIPGYCVGCVCAIFGVIILAMPIAIIASNFTEYYSNHKLLKSHSLLRSKSNGCFVGRITVREAYK